MPFSNHSFPFAIFKPCLHFLCFKNTDHFRSHPSFTYMAFLYALTEFHWIGIELSPRTLFRKGDICSTSILPILRTSKFSHVSSN